MNLFNMRFENIEFNEDELLSIIKEKDTKKVLVRIDPKYFRPTEVDLLIGDTTKARTKLGWVPEYDLEALVKEMVASDLNLMKKDQYLNQNGYQTLNYYE